MTIVTITNRTFQFSITIVRFIRLLPESSERQVFSRQLLRSATSIGANITEAQYSSTKRQFLQYYQIALRSSHETTYWLKLLYNLHGILRESLTNILNENEQISKVLTTSILNAKRNLQK